MDLSAFETLNRQLEPLRQVLGLLSQGEELARHVANTSEELCLLGRELVEKRTALDEVSQALASAQERHEHMMAAMHVEVAEARDKAEAVIAKAERDAIIAQRAINEQLRSAEEVHTKALKRMADERSDAEEDLRKTRERMTRILEAARLGAMHGE
jgi:hypothetical protein